MKKQLRKEILEKLNFLEPEERLEKSFQIKNKLFKLKEFQNARTIAFFVGIQNEVETMPMIDEALHLGKRIALPVTDFSLNEMRFFELHSLDELELNEKGLFEPNPEIEVYLNEIDLFIVPGIAFNLKGNRLGRGKGFYDRILKKIPINKTISLAFEFQILDRLPIEDHDMPVAKIVTEKRVIECRE